MTVTAALRVEYKKKSYTKIQMTFRERSIMVGLFLPLRMNSPQDYAAGHPCPPPTT